jgi:HAE1 family hydrophobic/amphiphilic exporter-1
MWLTRLAITRPVTILMLVLALIVLGLVSREKLPVDLYPDVEFPMVFITTVYPGTGPEEMETLISKPIEDSVSTISGVKKLSSTSSEGVSQVRMEFELGTKIDVAVADVRSKLDALRNSLPEDAQAPVVIKADVKAMPVISLCLASDKLKSIEVRRKADDLLKDRLSQLPGVASVFVSGGDVREVRVEVDQARLEAYGLSISQVVSALKAENLNLPSGAIDEAKRTSAVRVMGEFTDPAQILGVRIPNANGDPNLTVGDVAHVRDTVRKPTTHTRVDGGDSVALTVQKQTDANTVKVVEQVREELEKMTHQPFTDAGLAQQKAGRWKAPEGKALLPADEVTVSVAWDQSTFIKDTLHDVYQSLFEGALLAVLIVFLFLHSMRGTFIVALAIPTSMIATFIVMNALHFTINMMSMMGLSLSVGILVDDSIVVLENIHRHLKMGKTPRQAAIDGRTEIGLAAMTITMVDVVVFVPIAFMHGIVGQFFKQFGIVVATATLFSLFVSFTLTPMLASRWLKSHEEEEADEQRAHARRGLFQRFVDFWNRTYDALSEKYQHLLHWALAHRSAVVGIGVMTFFSSLAIVMPKPLFLLKDAAGAHPGPALAALPLQIGVMLLVAALWWPVRNVRPLWGRILYGVLGVIPSIMLIAKSTKMIDAGSPMPMMLMLALLAGIMAYAFSVPSGAAGSPAATPLAVFAAVLLLVCLFVPAKFGVEFFPKVDRRQFTVKVETEVGTSLTRTDTIAREVEDYLLTGIPETKTVFTTVGASGGNRFGGGGGGESDTAEMNVELKEREGDLRSTDEVMKEINARYRGVPGMKVMAAEESSGPGGSAIDIEVCGDNMQRIQQVADQISEIVKATEGTYGVELSWRDGRPELQAHIDRDRAAQYGISVAQIAGALRTTLEGDTSTKYRENGKEYDIRVFLPEQQRDTLTQVPNMVVGSSQGRPVYLYEVMRLEPAAGPTKIDRINRQRSVTISGNLQAGYALGNVQQQIVPKLAAVDTRGVTVNWSGQAEEMKNSFSDMGNALMLSIGLVFMLMSALFESLLSPLIIMLSVPQAMSGALYAMSFTSKALSIISMIGIIMLVGLVTKNAILMVDYTNTLRHGEGLSRRDALLRAGPTRLRPILMTTLAMIFGMLPTALALAKGSEMRQPMAIVVIGGLLVSMFLTLLMVPIFYEIMDDITQAIGRARDRLFGVRPAVEPMDMPEEIEDGFGG